MHRLPRCPRAFESDAMISPSRAWLLPIALLIVSDAAAQVEGLIRPLRLQRADGYVELGYEWEDQDREPPLNGRAFNEREATLAAALNARLDGSFLHPSLLPFSVSGTWRRRASSIVTSTGRFQGEQAADASQMRFHLGILPAFTWSGAIDAYRFVQDIDSTFAPRRTVLRSEVRGSVSRRSRRWPLRIQWSDTRAVGIEGDPRDETRKRWLAHLDYRGEDATARAEVEQLDYVERSVSQDYVLTRVTATNSWRPGGSRKLILATTVYGYDRVGTSESSNTILSQSVDWRPTDTFYARGVIDYQEQNDLAGRLSVERASVNADHRLWGSLTTRFYASDERNDLFEQGRLDQTEGSLDFDYTRRRERGTLSLNWGRRFRWNWDRLPNRRTIATENAVYQLGVLITLEQPGVIESTVQITDADGLVVYVEGFDYELRPIGALLEVYIIPGGAILPGASLRITYAAEASRSLDVLTETHRSGIGWQDRSGLWFRYYRSRQSQDVLFGIADGRIDQTTDQNLGVGVRRRRWQIEATLNDRASQILAYRITQYNGRWNAPVSRRLSLGVQGRIQKSTFPDRGDERIDLSLIGVDAQLKLRRLRVDALLERWNETIFGNKGRYMQGSVTAQWSFREIDLLFYWRLRKQDVELSGRDDRQQYRLTVRRYFR